MDLQLRMLRIAFLGLVVTCGPGAGAVAQDYSANRPLGASAQQMPAYLSQAGLEQRLGQPLPIAAVFTDETGRTGALQTWFDGKLVALALV